jgi:hypothetical protein
MSEQLTVNTGRSDIEEFILNSWRPEEFKNGQPYYDGHPCPLSSADLRTNAFLQREEWESLDAAIVARAKQRLNIYGDLISMGLRSQGSVAEWYSKWRVASEVTAAAVTMDFETDPEGDRPDHKIYGVPVPIISKAFSIGRRELASARASGTPLDTSAAEECATSVAEMVEQIIVDGNTSIVVQGDSIPGLRTVTGRYNPAAAGDFGTLSNIEPTFVEDVLPTMHTRRYHGPWNFYMHPTQYGEMQQRYTDGSGARALQELLALPEINAIKPNDLMTAGEFIGLQMTRDVIDYREALSLETRRWEHPSGSRLFYVVLLMGTPRLKINYATQTGVAHVTGA